jgi:hypothetical protein
MAVRFESIALGVQLGRLLHLNSEDLVVTQSILTNRHRLNS